MKSFVPLVANMQQAQVDNYAREANIQALGPILGSKYSEVMAGTVEYVHVVGTESINLVLAFWAWATYERMVPYFGLDVSANGLTKAKGERFDPLSDAERARVLSNATASRSFYEGLLRNAVQLDNPDTVQGPTNNPGMAISVLGARPKSKKCGEEYNWRSY